MLVYHIPMTETIQIVKQNKKGPKILQRQETKILSLDDSADDDLHKIYFVESESIKGKYYKIIATAFGATSCSCIEQTKNLYQHCKHMKILDEIMEHSTNRIQKTSNIH